MNRTVFNVDDIHQLRVDTAKRYAGMSPDAARQDRQKQADDTRRAIEKIRVAKTNNA